MDDNKKEYLTSDKMSEFNICLKMLEYAERFYPDLAFGIAIQIMGGTRMVENVYLTTKDVKINNLSSNINISIKLMKNQKNNEVESRMITVFNCNGRLLQIYENHLEFLRTNANECAKNLGSLFIDSDGNPMNITLYRKRIKKLKEEFATKLEMESHLQAEILRKSNFRRVFIEHFLECCQRKSLPHDIELIYRSFVKNPVYSRYLAKIQI